MAAILSAAFPDKAPHMFAYMRTIVRASRTFESTAWASYDVAYRRQAANRGSLDWGVLDSGLYNDAFMGVPRLFHAARIVWLTPSTPASALTLRTGSRWTQGGRRCRQRPSHPGRGVACPVQRDLPPPPWRYVGYLIPLVGIDAVSQDVVMHTCAKPAMRRIRYRSVVRSDGAHVPDLRCQRGRETQSCPHRA